MELKMCCSHSFLFESVEDTTVKVKTTVETLIRASGKMILLDKLLLRLREKGLRVLVSPKWWELLIFCQIITEWGDFRFSAWMDQCRVISEGELLIITTLQSQLTTHFSFQPGQEA
jgi:hypothetical protein